MNFPARLLISRSYTFLKTHYISNFIMDFFLTVHSIMEGRKRAYFLPTHLSFQGIKMYEKRKQARKELAFSYTLVLRKNRILWN